MSKAASRLSHAVARGVDEYRRRSEKSSRRKRDGAVRDAVENWAAALGETMREASDVPADLAKGLDSKTVPRSVRGVMRLLTSPFRR